MSETHEVVTVNAEGATRVLAVDAELAQYFQDRLDLSWDVTMYGWTVTQVREIMEGAF